MKCARAQELISSFLDEQLDEAGSRVLAEHLAACPSCAEEMQLMGHMKRVLESVPPRRCPDIVWTGVSREIASSPAPAVRGRRHQTLSPAWVVAGAAIVCMTCLRGPEPVADDGTPILPPLATGRLVMTSAPAPTADAFSTESVFSDDAQDALSAAPAQTTVQAETEKAAPSAVRRISQAAGRDRGFTPVFVHAADREEQGTHFISSMSRAFRSSRWSGHRDHPAERPAPDPSPRARERDAASPTLVATRVPIHRGEPAFFSSPLGAASGHLSPAQQSGTANHNQSAAGGTGPGSAGGSSTPLDGSEAARIASLVKNEQSDTQALDQTAKDLVGMSLQAGGTDPAQSGV